jgi:hypothetical protein
MLKHYNISNTGRITDLRQLKGTFDGGDGFLKITSMAPLQQSVYAFFWHRICNFLPFNLNNAEVKKNDQLLNGGNPKTEN